MTDDLEKLGQALRRQTPPSADGAKERALQAAMENFQAHAQGSAEEARPNSDRPHWVARLLEGLKTMTNLVTTRAAMMGTASVAAVALALFLVNDQPGLDPVRTGGPVADALPQAPAAAPEEFQIAAVEEDELHREPTDSSAAFATPPAPAPAPFNGGQSPQTDLSRARMADAAATPRPTTTAKAAVAATVDEQMVMAEADIVNEEAAPLQETIEDIACTDVASCLTPGMEAITISASLADSTKDLQPGEIVMVYWTGTLPDATKPGTVQLFKAMRVIEIDETAQSAQAGNVLSLKLEMNRGDASIFKDAQAAGSIAVVRKGSPEAIVMAEREAASEELVIVLIEEEVLSPAPEASKPVITRERADKAESDMSAQDEFLMGGLYEDEVSSTNAAPSARVQFESVGAPVVSERVISFDDVAAPVPETNTERFPDAAPGNLKQVKTAPVSTFSIDVDTASYSFIRSSLMLGQKPPAEAVRIEEMINYFDYDYPMPETRDVPFRTSVSVTDTPWNEGTKLIQIGIQGYDLPNDDRPDANLVFLIDTSGSMQDANKLPLLIQSFRLLLTKLGENDTVAIVTYAGSAGVVLEPTPASERSKILNSLTRLSAGGSTAGQAGLQQAYALAEDMNEDGDVTRVILATDGDFNVGISDTEELKTYIEGKRKTGVYLSVLGFGRGNTNDQLMQALAQNGNGTAAYIDTLAEAQKVLVEEASGALFPIANDVKIQMEFNPAQIAEYRLIGYETRALKREDFNNDAVDAGEIGAGHTVTAIYEVTPVGSPAIRIDPLRYGTEEQVAVSNDNPEYGFLRLRYKLPGESRSKLIETPILADRADIPASEVAFATVVAGFGEYLRGSAWLGEWGPAELQALAGGNRGEDRFGYRAEFIRLMGLAQTAQ